MGMAIIEKYLLFLPCDDGMNVITRVIAVPAKRKHEGDTYAPAAPESLLDKARRVQAVHEDGSVGGFWKKVC